MTEIALADWAPEVHTLAVVPEVPESMDEALTGLNDGSSSPVAAGYCEHLLVVLNWHKN